MVDISKRRIRGGIKPYQLPGSQPVTEERGTEVRIKKLEDLDNPSILRSVDNIYDIKFEEEDGNLISLPAAFQKYGGTTYPTSSTQLKRLEAEHSKILKDILEDIQKESISEGVGGAPVSMSAIRRSSPIKTSEGVDEDWTPERKEDYQPLTEEEQETEVVEEDDTIDVGMPFERTFVHEDGHKQTISVINKGREKTTWEAGPEASDFQGRNIPYKSIKAGNIVLQNIQNPSGGYEKYMLSQIPENDLSKIEKWLKFRKRETEPQIIDGKLAYPPSGEDWQQKQAKEARELYMKYLKIPKNPDDQVSPPKYGFLNDDGFTGIPDFYVLQKTESGYEPRPFTENEWAEFSEKRLNKIEAEEREKRKKGREFTGEPWTKRGPLKHTDAPVVNVDLPEYEWYYDETTQTQKSRLKTKPIINILKEDGIDSDEITEILKREEAMPTPPLSDATLLESSVGEREASEEDVKTITQPTEVVDIIKEAQVEVQKTQERNGDYRKALADTLRGTKTGFFGYLGLTAEDKHTDEEIVGGEQVMKNLDDIFEDTHKSVENQVGDNFGERKLLHVEEQIKKLPSDNVKEERYKEGHTWDSKREEWIKTEVPPNGTPKTDIPINIVNNSKESMSSSREDYERQWRKRQQEQSDEDQRGWEEKYGSTGKKSALDALKEKYGLHRRRDSSQMGTGELLLRAGGGLVGGAAKRVGSPLGQGIKASPSKIASELAANREYKLKMAAIRAQGGGGQNTMQQLRDLTKNFGGSQIFGQQTNQAFAQDTQQMMGGGQSALTDFGRIGRTQGSSTLTDFSHRIQSSGSGLTDFSQRVGGTSGHLGGALAHQMSGAEGTRGIFTSGKEFLESRGRPTSLRLMGQRDKDVMSFSLGGTLGLGASMRPEQGLGSPSGFRTGELVPQRQTQNRAPRGTGFRGRRR